VDWDDGSLFGDGGYDDAEPGSASGIYDPVDFDDWYVYSDSSSARTNGITKTVCASKHSQIVSKEDSVLLSNYLSTCSGSHCTICKGLGSNLRNPEWMLDSGATAHFTPVFSDFIAFTRFKEPLKVNMASTPIIQFGFGTVLLSYPLFNSKMGIEETKTLRIRDVLFVPHITQRILSLGEFLDQGMHVYGDAHMMTLILPKSLTLVFQCSPLYSGEKLFWLRASSVTLTSLNLVVVEDYELMHRRLGHPSKEVMQRALQNTRGFPKVDFPRCETICPGCAQGKMPQKAFPPSSSRASAPFDKIHLDLKQFPIESYHRHKYFISFVDDYSGYSWITLLRQKSSAIIALKDFLVMVQTQYGRTIKEWMSDVGGEYKSDAFLSVLKAKGIKILQSVPFVPQQNGHAERFNRTIMNKKKGLCTWSRASLNPGGSFL
jgi:Integrase core domain/GAG-pre-integrase domain